MKIALVGWGVETQSAYRYFGEENDYLIVNEEPRDDFPVESKTVKVRYNNAKRPPGLTGNSSDLSYLHGLESFDLIIYSVVALKNLRQVYAADSPIWAKTKSILHIFFESCPSKNIIGVTGTKGKGTTSTLIYLMLEAAGKRAHLAGNIGIPVLDILPEVEVDDCVVLELSNFQLYQFSYSPHIAVHLMMLPEHLDWHKDMEEYVEAKSSIFKHQSENDIAVYYPLNEHSERNVSFSKGKHVPFCAPPGAFVTDNLLFVNNEPLLETSHIALLGEHNLQNVCAAVTAYWQICNDKDAIVKVLQNFSGLPYRLQFEREVNGVQYFNDSFGTTPDTAIVAMDAFANNKVMIVGGSDKGADYSAMAKRLAEDDIRHIVAIGVTGEKIAQLVLDQAVEARKVTVKPLGDDWTMQEIVEKAAEQAKPGDVVLLSTGSASFGIFNDYKDRGKQFSQVVKSLSEAE